MKTPIKIRYLVLILLGIGGVMFWYGLPYQQRVAVLQQAATGNDFNKTFTGNYLAGYMASKKGDWEKAAELFEESRKLAPKNTALLENTYTFKLLYGEVGEAVQLARQHPDNEEASTVSVILRAMDAMQSQRYGQARKLIETITPGKQEDISVGTVISPFFLAWTEVGEGKPKEALSILQDIQQREMARALASYQLALMYDYLGQDKEAETAYKDALEGEIKPYHYVLGAGSFYARHNKMEEAKAVFESYITSNPASELFQKELEALAQGNIAYFGKKPSLLDGWAEVLMEGVRISYQSNLKDEGVAYLQLVNYLKPGFPQGLMLLAGHYEEISDYKNANAFYARMPEDSSFYWESRINRARNDYKAGRKEAAEKMLRELALEKPDDYAAPLELAELLREDERFAVAADEYAQVVSRIPSLLAQHWYVLYAQGVAYEQSNQWEKAEAAFQKALDLNPGQPDVSNYLGYSWLVQGKQIEKAKAMIETAVEARPDDAHILDSMGWMLFLTGEYHKAASYLEQAIESMPYDSTVNDHLGDIYWRLGRFKEAQYQWQRALDASSPPPAADEAKKIAQKLRDGLSGGTITPEMKQLSTNEHL